MSLLYGNHICYRHPGEIIGDSQTTIVDEIVYDIVGCHAILTFVNGKLVKIEKF
jgi:hypothetical protein